MLELIVTILFFRVFEKTDFDSDFLQSTSNRKPVHFEKDKTHFTSLLLAFLKKLKVSKNCYG